MIHINVRQTNNEGKILQDGIIDFIDENKALIFLKDTRENHEKIGRIGTSSLKINIITTPDIFD